VKIGVERKESQRQHLMYSFLKNCLQMCFE